MHGNPAQEEEIQLARTIIFPTGKSGRVERTGHSSPVQWQTVILGSQLCLLRWFPFRVETQEPTIGKTLAQTLSIRHNMEEKYNFKQYGSSENHAFPGWKPIIHEQPLNPNSTVSKKEKTWQNNIFYTPDHRNQILSIACLNQWLTDTGHHNSWLTGEE